MRQNSVNESIWDDLLLLKVEVEKFENLKTLTTDAISEGGKFQIFEVLVAETLAVLEPDTKWQTTVGGNDGGIDFIGYRSAEASPYIAHHPEQVILGQVKRRGSRYKYEDFRNDIGKAFEYYTSTFVEKDKSLFQLVFIISTSNETYIANLRKNLLKEWKKKKRLTFIANIKSPISVIDASEIIKYWKFNFGFVKDILQKIISDKQLQLLKDYINNIDANWITVNISESKESFIGKVVEKRVTINSELKELPLDIKIRCIIPKESCGIVQILKPLSLIQPSVVYSIKVYKSYTFSMQFRGLREGIFDLGFLEITSPDITLLKRINLGTIYFRKTLFPVLQQRPNEKIYRNIVLQLKEADQRIQVNALVGCGGIGKSTMAQEVAILASNLGYFCVDLALTNNKFDGKNFIKMLLLQIISQSNPAIIYEGKIINYLVYYLQHMFRDCWLDDLEVYFNGCGSYNNNHIIECVVSCVIKVASRHKVFIWLSDLHWLDQETAQMLQKILSALHFNESFLENPVVIALEGRDNEMLVVDGKYYLPHAWLTLLKSPIFQIHKLMHWNKRDSLALINAVFGGGQNSIDLPHFQKLSSILLEQCGGVPFHILEQIKYLIDLEKLGVRSDGELFIIDTSWGDVFSDKLKHVVSMRLAFYQYKYPDLLDYLIVYVNLSQELLIPFTALMKLSLSKIYAGIDEILNDCGFVSTINQRLIFQHEYYVQTLKTMPIKNENHLEDCIKWLDAIKAKSIRDSLSLIQLLLKKQTPDYEYISQISLTLLKETSDGTIRQRICEMLCRVPPQVLEKHGMPLYKVLFELSEIIIQYGDYSLSKQYSLDLLKIDDFDNWDYLFHSALAYENLSNTSADEMLFDEAIRYAEKGIEFVDNILRRADEHNAMNLYQAREILVERLAICYLFIGNFIKAELLQKEAYESASHRKDRYTLLRIGYEMGDVALYKNASVGISLLEQCYIDAQEIITFRACERHFIKAMSLVGRLIQLTTTPDEAKIKGDNANNIYAESLTLYEILEREHDSYTVSINLITLGVACLFKNEDTSQAMHYFMLAMETAMNACLDNLLWKCHFNVAEICKREGNYTDALYHARKSMDMINRSIEINAMSRESLIRTLLKPVRKLEEITKEANSYFLQYTFNDSTNPPHNIVWNDCTLFLMN